MEIILKPIMKTVKNNVSSQKLMLEKMHIFSSGYLIPI
jgi:hypothetical protein